MILGTTTSTRDSGLLDVLVPAFEKASSSSVKTVAVGSGEALAMGEKGNADVLLVHSPVAEEAFMAAGHGLSRKAVMHNDFVIVGPASDPAGVAKAGDAGAAMALIARAKVLRLRGDDSGTNAKELQLWKAAKITPSGSWYFITGQGMGQTLTIASQKQAYTLSDRGTFLATKNLSLKILSRRSDDLRNNYHVIVVKHTGTNLACAQAFSDWITSGPVQKQIASFGIAQYGQALFVPDAGRDGPRPTGACVRPAAARRRPLLIVSISATLIALVIGVPLATPLAMASGRRPMIAAVNTDAIPTVAVGLVAALPRCGAAGPGRPEPHVPLRGMA
jgi:tungstate transport system substrate-binding protein